MHLKSFLIPADGRFNTKIHTCDKNVGLRHFKWLSVRAASHTIKHTEALQGHNIHVFKVEEE